MSGFHSLKRLQMDHIDLYQIHWPDRSRHFKVLHSCVSSYVPMFGETEYDPVRQFSSVPIEEQLDALGRAVDAGKIRYIGLSNETPYGVMKFLHFAENNVRYPKIISVQVVCAFMVKSNMPSVSLICIGGADKLIFFRIHIACSAELLILEWLSAVIMRGTL
ncbi:hypothetical protein Goklo_020153 [Gossypium klotzschianum]|uniref:NADP-dependent oxidoreductase domain-containing protein n=1 Tax=Gossypium klotzschianum TaxID=34286 RepID=A0A7J8UQZ0_9ROSI|nr:hypothetical protein [Gossypium klotzschianum]